MTLAATGPEKHPITALRISAENANRGELLLYGNIGADGGLSWLFDETTPRSFYDDLKELGPIDELHVYINSDGGDVFAAQAMHSQLRRLTIPVTAHIDGLAASSASLVAVAADRVVMPANAMMMIHSPWVQSFNGNAVDLRQMAGVLDRVQESMIGAYTAKTGQTAEPIADLLDAETWMTAAEAMELGFADEVEPAKALVALAVSPGVWNIAGQVLDLTPYAHAPKQLDELLRDAKVPPRTKRSAEKALRDAGFTRAQANEILLAGWNGTPPAPAAILAPPEAEDGRDVFADYAQLTASGIRSRLKERT